VAAANELLTSALMARTEAVKRQVPVTLCASPDPTVATPNCSATGAGTNGGFIVWVDWIDGKVDGNGNPIITDATDGNAVVDAGEVVLRRSLQPPSAAPNGTLNVWGDFGYVTYFPNGFADNAQGLAGPATRVLYCDERGNRMTTGNVSTARAVRIEPTGRAFVQQDPADVTNALAVINSQGVAAVCP
jgi:Tfp pilus assembly protein FimT